MSAPDKRVVSLLLEDTDGNRETVELPGPGGTIRCGVGAPGCRSGVWRIWADTKKNKSDVYIALRTLAGYQKWSLHESGDWRFQWVSHARALEFTESTNRVIERWEQPPEIGTSGVTKGFTIWVRHCDVVPIADDDDPSHAQVQWLPTPPAEHAIGIHITVARPDQGGMLLKGAVPFDGFTLADGRVVLAVLSHSEIPAETTAALREAQIQALRSADVDWRTVAAPRIAIVGADSDDVRVVWDTAVVVKYAPPPE